MAITTEHGTRDICIDCRRGKIEECKDCEFDLKGKTDEKVIFDSDSANRNIHDGVF